MNTILQQRIEEAAHQYIQSDAVAPENMQLAFGDFINGAKWALRNQWISVEEALPARARFLDGEESDKSIYVLVRHKNEAVTSAWYCYCTKVWYFAVGRKGDNSIHAEITHWMPIPELKKGGEK